MSGVAIIRSILVNDATLTTAIPADRIMAGVVPIGAELPAISITQVSGVNSFRPVGAPGSLTRERVQVTIEANKYPQVKSVMKLVKGAFSTYARGTYAGFKCDSVIPDNEGPDLRDPETEICSQSHDFIVNWIS
ncbi:hypothetical protein [Nitrosomonas oligotropha]|uniref:hypothetical protein n=1 Tax=Nitrosomonas oligotropha TaxID=42354 RepID=UPI00136A94C9|nr:hypothetical protein [Nitrosomonas oligotropha]MXS81576.1 DUF3168 domain-containing protein [Nitrosomonas oligotropha]